LVVVGDDGVDGVTDAARGHQRAGRADAARLVRRGAVADVEHQNLGGAAVAGELAVVFVGAAPREVAAVGELPARI